MIAHKESELLAKDKLISAKESEISEKDQGLISLQQRCGSLQTQLETVQRRNQSLEVSGFSCYVCIVRCDMYSYGYYQRGKERKG